MLTTTDLRSKTVKLVDTLKKGGEVILVHRSKIIGRIKPAEAEAKNFQRNDFRRFTSKLKLPKLSDNQIRKRYSDYIKENYGQDLS